MKIRMTVEINDEAAHALKCGLKSKQVKSKVSRGDVRGIVAQGLYDFAAHDDACYRLGYGDKIDVKVHG